MVAITLLENTDMFTYCLTFCDLTEWKQVAFSSKYLYDFVFGELRQHHHPVNMNSFRSSSDILFKLLCVRAIQPTLKLYNFPNSISVAEIEDRVEELKIAYNPVISWFTYYRKGFKLTFDPNYVKSENSALRFNHSNTVVTFDESGTYWEGVTSEQSMRFGHIHRWNIIIDSVPTNYTAHILLGVSAPAKETSGNTQKLAFDKNNDGLGFATNDWSIRRGIEIIPKSSLQKRLIRKGDVFSFEFDYRTTYKSLTIYLNGKRLAYVASSKPKSFGKPDYYITACIFKQVSLRLQNAITCK
jgi:hypothetical protein